MRVIVRKAAHDDLERVFAHIAEVNPIAAQAVVSRILAAIERIGFFPRMGRHGDEQGTRESVVTHLPYIVVYHIDDLRREVSILGVFHTAKDR